MIEINMSGCEIGIGEPPDGAGAKILRIADAQSNIAVVLVLDPMAAVHVANGLMGKGLVVPNGLGPLEQAQARLRPPMPPPPPAPDAA